MARTLWIFLISTLALTAIAQSPNSNSEPIVIKARLHHNRFTIPCQINTQPAWVLLDTANTIPTLHPNLVTELKLEPSGSIPIEGIAGDERASTYRNVTFDFAGAQYRPRRVASIPSERDDSRRRRDAVLGSGFFQRFVVELDPRASAVRLHSPTNFQYTGPGEILPFRLRKDTPVVEASLLFSTNDTIEGEFEIDTGCDSGLCIGAHFVKEKHLLEKLQTDSSRKFGVGGTVETRDGRIPILRLGKIDIERPQADLYETGSPVDPPLAGHIGMSALHHYKVIFDYSRRQMILEPLK